MASRRVGVAGGVPVWQVTGIGFSVNGQVGGVALRQTCHRGCRSVRIFFGLVLRSGMSCFEMGQARQLGRNCQSQTVTGAKCSYNIHTIVSNIWLPVCPVIVALHECQLHVRMAEPNGWLKIPATTGFITNVTNSKCSFLVHY